jgi:hypothetical protein
VFRANLEKRNVIDEVYAVCGLEFSGFQVTELKANNIINFEFS